MPQKDSIIILAWPKTPAKAIGRWYDVVTKFLGFLKDGYYIAGHAAAVIVNHEKKELHYFDFGRYHMPTKFGRARSKETDPGLKIKTFAVFSANNTLINIEEILTELFYNENCKGKGKLFASVLENVDFSLAFEYAKTIQNNDAVSYGPYSINGTNCSRFITSIAKKSNPKFMIKLKLSFSFLLTPLTKANVFACNNYYYTVNEQGVFKHKVSFKEQISNYMLPVQIKL